MGYLAQLRGPKISATELTTLGIKAAPSTGLTEMKGFLDHSSLLTYLILFNMPMTSSVYLGKKV